LPELEHRHHPPLSVKRDDQQPTEAKPVAKKQAMADSDDIPL